MVLMKKFKALGDPVRLRLFALLAGGRELCVCHLTAALALPQSTVSRHLGVLRYAGLVDTRREGKWIYYRVSGELAEDLAVLVCRWMDETHRIDVMRLAAALGEEGFGAI